jgi:hypothetical protein
VGDQILGDGMTDRMWEATTNHAKTCASDDKVFAHTTPHGTIYVDSIFNIVRVDLVGGVQWPLQVQQLNRGQTVSRVAHHLRTEGQSSMGFACPDMCTLFRLRQMMVQQLLLDAYEHRQSLQEADAFMLHGHAANNVPLLQSKCPNIQIPQPSRLSVSKLQTVRSSAL